MYAMRARFKNEIVAECLPPAKRFLKAPMKVAIMCTGMPGMPSKNGLLEFLSEKGYWAFNPRYRGTWESGGTFLKKSPHRDVLDIIDQLPRGFKDAYTGTMFKIKPADVHIFASSFGGPAAILASRDRRISKAVAFSPVVDWAKEGKVEKIHELKHFVREGFGEGYRIDPRGWAKLQSGKFYNPQAEWDTIDGEKLFFIAAKDDDVVPWRTVKSFADLTDATLMLLKHGGHFGVSAIMEPKFWKRIKKFLSKK